MNRFYIVMFSLLCLQSTINTEESFTVLSWNILGPDARDVTDFGPEGEKFTNNPGRVGKHADYIKRINPDIVCLQEVREIPMAPSVKKDLITYLVRDGNYEFVEHQQKGVTGGVATFVKKGVFDVDPTSQKSLKLENTEQEASVGAAVYTKLSLSKDPQLQLSVINAHINRGNSNRPENVKSGQSQWTSLFKDVGRIAVPSIIVGDFNTRREEVKHDIKHKDGDIPSTLKFISTLAGHKYSMYDHEFATVENNPKNIKKAIEYAKKKAKDAGKSKKEQKDAVTKAEEKAKKEYAIDHVLYTKDGLSLDNDNSMVGPGAEDPAKRISENFPSDHAPVLVRFTFGSSDSSEKKSQKSKKKKSAESSDDADNQDANKEDQKEQDGLAGDHVAGSHDHAAEQKDDSADSNSQAQQQYQKTVDFYNNYISVLNDLKGMFEKILPIYSQEDLSDKEKKEKVDKDFNGQLIKKESVLFEEQLELVDKEFEENKHLLDQADIDKVTILQGVARQLERKYMELRKQDTDRFYELKDRLEGKLPQDHEEHQGVIDHDVADSHDHKKELQGIEDIINRMHDHLDDVENFVDDVKMCHTYIQQSELLLQVLKNIYNDLSSSGKKITKESLRQKYKEISVKYNLLNEDEYRNLEYEVDNILRQHGLPKLKSKVEDIKEEIKSIDQKFHPLMQKDLEDIENDIDDMNQQLDNIESFIQYSNQGS